MESTEGDGVRVRGKKKIQVSASTLVDLKAALFQKQQQVKKEKAAQQHDTSLPREVSDKTSAIWRKAVPLNNGRRTAISAAASKEEGARERNQAEEAEYDRARRALEAKVAVYERLSKGQGLQEEEALEGDGDEEDGRYLVDFTRKAYEEMLTADERKDERAREEIVKEEETRVQEDKDIGPDEEWVDYLDALGRNRRCLAKDLPHIKALDQELKEKAHPPARSPSPELLSEDMKMDRERREWERRAEEEAAQNRPIGPVHYQDVYPGEIRAHGVGYFAFSGDEEKREEQMNLLNKLRDQTLDQRQRRELMKEKRKAAMDARLAKVRQRKLKQEGGEAGAGGGGEAEGVADLDFEEKQEDVIALELQKMRKEVERQGEEKRMRQEEEQRAKHVRPWDKGKVDFIKRRKQELEDERLNEFAPPQSYAGSGGFRENRKPVLRREILLEEEESHNPATPTSPSSPSRTPSYPPPQSVPYPPPQPSSPSQTPPYPPPQPSSPSRTPSYPPPQSVPYLPPQTVPYPPPLAAQYPGWPPFAVPMYYMPYPGMCGGYSVPGYYGMPQPGTSHGQPGMGMGTSSNTQPMQGQVRPNVPPPQSAVPPLQLYMPEPHPVHPPQPYDPVVQTQSSALTPQPTPP